jgi:hypothetical protein
MKHKIRVQKRTMADIEMEVAEVRLQQERLDLEISKMELDRAGWEVIELRLRVEKRQRAAYALAKVALRKDHKSI